MCKMIEVLLKHVFFIEFQSADWFLFNHSPFCRFKNYQRMENRSEYSGGSRTFRWGGVDLVGEAWTPKMVTFRKICMSKRKNRDPWGGVRQARPPLDPPME